MKMLGGEWSRGDAIALIGVLVALIGSVAAVLAIPGMPKFLHGDSDNAPKQQSSFKPVRLTKDVTSGQITLGCDQSLQPETPVVSFGKNARDIEGKADWAAMDNIKSHNQNVVTLTDAADRHPTGIKATGTITGLDSQSILGVKNCPGGGHGELTLHVTWTEDRPAEER